MVIVRHSILCPVLLLLLLFHSPLGEERSYLLEVVGAFFVFVFIYKSKTDSSYVSSFGFNWY